MLVDDQREVIEFLSSPATHGGAPVERIDTHSSIVFLAGSRAYKLKRAVKFDYLDYSTVDRRRAMCEAEVALNQPAAPGIYRGALPITQTAGVLAFGSLGSLVDWVVAMNRFDQDCLFDRLAHRGELSVDLVERLATAVARFHEKARRIGVHGGADGMSWVIEGNASGLAEFGADLFDRSALEQVIDASRRELSKRRSLLDARKAEGWVRQCHGDLHLRNIVLLNGDPTLFDGVEFNDEISCIDVFYDLAFLLMDLWRRGLQRLANAALNRYVADTRDVDGLTLLPLFLSCRAAVRAKTNATSAALARDLQRREELRQSAGVHLALAGVVLRPARPTLVAIGGLSGSGKSTLAMALAPRLGPVPGAIVVRSDEIRKELSGIDRYERLPPTAYTARMSAHVYHTLCERAVQVLEAGHSVIVDAVFSRSEDRDAIEHCAAAAGVDFAGLWLSAPAQVLSERVTGRPRDVSDADVAVVHQQLQYDVGRLRWPSLNASASFDAVLRQATATLESAACGVRLSAPA